MSIAKLGSIDLSSFDLISVDVFDTILLRDGSSQRARFAETADLVAMRLSEDGKRVDPDLLYRMRCRTHDLAYRAVALERPYGDATLSRMIETQRRLLGLPKEASDVFYAGELEIECRHLTPNRALCEKLEIFSRAGKRVVALSDIYLNAMDLAYLVNTLCGTVSIACFYSSSDIGLTKHAGQAFAKIAALEKTPLQRMLHCGDDAHSDVMMAQAAGCHSVWLPRPAHLRHRRKLAAAWTLLREPTG